MKIEVPLLMLMLIGCFSCHTVPSGQSVDRGEARKISDDFISSLQTGHFDAAFDLMDPEFVRTVDRRQAAAFARGILDFCGYTKPMLLKRDEVGVEIFGDGRTAPMRKFIYGVPSADVSSEGCVIYVEVLRENGRMMVNR